MGKTRENTERQLSHAKDAVTARASVLKEKGIAENEHRRDTIWRKLDAQVRSVRKQLKQITKIEARDQAVIERKSGDESDS